MLPLGEYLVSLTEPGLRPLQCRRRGADVDVDLHLLAIGQQLYALSLQLLDAQAFGLLAELLHVVSPPLLRSLLHSLPTYTRGRCHSNRKELREFLPTAPRKCRTFGYAGFCK